MKKFASALAVAAVLAAPSAQAIDATITGYVAAGIANYDYSGTAPGTADGEIKIDDGRYSRFRFAAVEDLGNGLKADFMIEQRFLSDNAGLSGVANGNVWVALSGGFGKVSLGRIDTYYSDGVLTELSRATSFASLQTLSLLAQVNGAYAVTPSRHNNQLRYDTPNFGGFSATLAYSSASGADGNELLGAGNGDTMYASARYLKGPVYAGVSYIQQGSEGVTSNDTTGIRGYGSFTLPFGLKIGLNVDQTEVEAAGGATSERLAAFIPLTFKTGGHAIYASYGMADDLETSAGDVPNSGAKVYTLGYDYALSNRTSVGVNWTQVENDPNSSYQLFLGGIADSLGGSGIGAGVDARQLYLGVAHAF